MEIKEVILTLMTAPRNGADVDIPEGSRYIEISETLVNEIVECLKEHAHEPVIKTYSNIREIQ